MDAFAATKAMLITLADNDATDTNKVIKMIIKMIKNGPNESVLEKLKNDMSYDWDAVIPMYGHGPGTTLLMTAVQCKNTAIIRALLGAHGQKKANPNLPGFYPLHKAIYMRSHSATIELLLAGGCDPNRINSSCETPLSAAVEVAMLAPPTTSKNYFEEQFEVVDTLLASGAQELPCKPVCFIPADRDDLNFLKALVRRGLSLTLRHETDIEEGHSILHSCALRGSVRCLRYLLTSGFEADPSFPSVNDPTDHTNSSPLSFAASSASVECARLLLEHGCYIDGSDSLGCTALGDLVNQSSEFYFEESLEFLQLLEDYGADFGNLDFDLFERLVESSPMRNYYLYLHILAK